MKKNNNTNMGGIVALILGVILCAWTGMLSGVKTCGKMIFAVLKSARKSITTYLTGSDEDRTNLRSSLKSILKTSAIALAIVLVAGLCITTLFNALIRATFTFVPRFLMDAIGYLFLGIMLRVVVRVAERLSVRSDITVKVRKMVEFGMSALVPVAIFSFLDNATADGITFILACCIASWGYRKINEIRAALVTTA